MTRTGLVLTLLGLGVSLCVASAALIAGLSAALGAAGLFSLLIAGAVLVLVEDD